ncbi:MAG: 3,4-dihydroxy-2-butanone-4-phosphate synthase [Acidiferrobacterales bacterium]|nr:3,4-dihydroxy-2-butanone-4-phosphate synthase [Acidiferrobacterales bacterium]
MNKPPIQIEQGVQVSPIEDLLADYRQGKMVILVDDEDRENEGDLLVAAECVTDEHINFMASHGRGLICLTLTEERCQQLDLPLMVSRNSARFSTNFTVSIEAAEGVTTGISAQDRAITIRTAVKRNAQPEDIVTPGHIFPIKAQPGGVLTRAGHTEAGVDMARLCGFESASVICEILKEDGTMARLPDLIEFGRHHQIKIGTIADLISYRLSNDPTVQRVAEQRMTMPQGEFDTVIYRDEMEGGVHMALLYGEIDSSKPVAVRVHVHRGLLDVLLDMGQEQSWELSNALESIVSHGSGVIVMLAYHESAEELASRVDLKRHSRRKNSDGQNASTRPQNPANLRMLGAGGQILRDLGVERLLALGREKRTYGLSGFGLEVVEYITDQQSLEKWENDHE